MTKPRHSHQHAVTHTDSNGCGKISGVQCHPALVDMGLPQELGEVRRETREATRAVVRNLSLANTPPPVVFHQHDGFIPVTSAQWRTILTDAQLLEQWRQVGSTVLELVSTACASGRSAGKKLPGLARSLHEAAHALTETMREVSWFSPPGAAKEERRAADDLVTASLRVVRAMLACLEQGWERAAWSAVRTRAVEAAAACGQLEAALAGPVNDVEDAYEVALGLSAAELKRGSGVTGRARLAAAWARNPDGLDRRLRRQMRHLIDDSLPLTGKLRQHLAALAVSDRPLMAHRAALGARDLVTAKLTADLDRTRSVVARHVQREPLMLSAYRGQVSAWDAYRRATHEEDQVRPLADLYRVVLEGDVKWTAAVVLDLLGRALPARMTLATARDLLITENAEPLCSMLASVIKPEWRNAIAHEELRWDSSHGMAVLGGQLVDLDELLNSALCARTICQGFEHGVAVSYAHNAQMNPWDTSELNEVARLLDMLQAIGEVGQPVLDIHRRGTCVQMDVPNMSIETLRTLFRALLRGAQVDKAIDRWEVRQEADRPVLCIKRIGIQAALRLAEGLWETVDPLPFAELPLVANAMVNSGETAETAVSTVLAVAASHVVGERHRLTGLLTHGDRAAKEELLATVNLICRGAEAAAQTLNEDKAKRRLVTFAKVLTGDCQHYAGAPPSALVGGLTPADRVLRRYAPARVPWIVPSCTATT